MNGPLDRNVVSLFGLPFDVVSVDEAVQILRDAVRERRRCFLSTPNVNFVVAAAHDAEFRQSVLESDLCVADGMPIVWAARLLGIKLPGRVAGSTLFERLRNCDGAPIKVYFFGGPEGAAAKACEQLNATPSGLVCVGYDSPGFGSVESMSTDAQIDRINRSGAEFVVVALGARKGQAWIRLNAARLDAPLVSHLGAVVNFVAGTLRRAPKWMQQSGLEWFWRITQEPKIWPRYWQDAVEISTEVCFKLVPLAFRLRSTEPAFDSLALAKISLTLVDGQLTIALKGAWADTNLQLLRDALVEAVHSSCAVDINLNAVTYIDCVVIGLLQVAMHVFGPRIKLTFDQCKSSVAEVIKYSNALPSVVAG